MNQRENLLSLYRRLVYEQAPVYFVLYPALQEIFNIKYPGQQAYEDVFQFL